MFDYFENGNQLFLKLDEGNMFICRLIRVLSVIEYIDENLMKIELGYVDFFGKKKRVVILPSQLNKSQLLKLSDCGIDVNIDNVDDVLDYLHYSLNKERHDYEHIRLHKKLGFFVDENGEICFKHYNLITKNGEENEENKSTYNGPLDLKPQGSFEECFQFLQDELKDNVNLQLACALSLATPFLWIVNHNSIDLESMVINITGNSSSGKSTALMLAMSLWGNANVTSNNNSTIKNWNSTSNALLKELSMMNYQGFPYALDELGLSSINDFTRLVYSVSSGTDKKRLTRSSEIMENDSFRTIVLSSGEMSMRDNMSSQTLGSKIIRLIELSNIEWTSSAEQAMRIKSFVKRNHGTFIPKFIHFILENYEEIIPMFEEYMNQIKDKVIEKIGVLGERLAMKFALILVAYESLMIFLELENYKDTDNISQILVDTLDGLEDSVDLAKKAYEAVMEDFVENSMHYISYKNTNYRNSKLDLQNPYMGKVYGKYSSKEIVITRTHFESLLSRKGFKDTRAILKEWMNKDVIVPENAARGRVNPFNRRILTEKTKVPVLVILRHNVYEEEVEEINEVKEKNRTSLPKILEEAQDILLNEGKVKF